jgi:hypothetical protein
LLQGREWNAKEIGEEQVRITALGWRRGSANE